MERPKKIMIMGRSIPIIEQNIEHTGLHGYFDPEKQIIVINSTSHHKFVTVIHEIIHSHFNRLGVDLGTISRDVQEILAETLSHMINENLSDFVKLKKFYKD